jgi:hypothetical protein
MTDYYDIILGLIPLTVGGVTAVLAAVGLSVSLAVSVGSLLSVGLIGHAMFVRAPVGEAPSRSGGDVPPSDTAARRGQRVNSAD